MLLFCCCNVAIAQPQRIERDLARSVSTLSDATSIRGFKDGELITTQGYDEFNDGGSNIYRYRRTGRSALPIGQIDGGFYISGSGSDDYLEAVNKDVINVKQFGAIGDGETDDTDALQAAIDRWKTDENNSRLEIPGGFYVISQTLDFTGAITNGGGIYCDPADITYRSVSSAVDRLGAALVWQGADDDGSAMVKIDSSHTTLILPTLLGRYTDGSANEPTYGLWIKKDSTQGTGGHIIDQLRVANCKTAFYLDTIGDNGGASSGNADRVHVKYFYLRDVASGFVNNSIANDGAQSVGLQFDRVEVTNVDKIFDYGVLTNTQVGQIIINGGDCTVLEFSESSGSVSMWEVESMKIDPAAPNVQLVNTTGITTAYQIEFSNIVEQGATLSANLDGEGICVLRDCGFIFNADMFTLGGTTGYGVSVVLERCKISSSLDAKDLVSTNSTNSVEQVIIRDCFDSNSQRRPDELFTGNSLMIGHVGSELSFDPNNPPEGFYNFWQSNGTGTGDDGDVIMKVTAASTTTTHYLTERAPLGYAQISIEDNATATTVASTQSDWSAKSQFVGFGTNFSDSSNATPDHTNDHITLTSAGTWEVTCVVTLSGSVVSDLWELALWKNNGATQISTKQGVNIRGAGLTYEKQVTISGLVDASANDTIELWVQRTNGTGSITITNAVMTAKKVSD